MKERDVHSLSRLLSISPCRSHHHNSSTVIHPWLDMFSYVLSVLEGTIEVKLPTIWTDEKQINYNYTSMIKQYTYNPTNLTNHGYPEYSTVWISQVISQVIGDIPTDWLSLTLVPLASMKRSIYRKEMLAKPKQTWWRHLMRTKETNDECFIFQCMFLDLFTAVQWN